MRRVTESVRWRRWAMLFACLAAAAAPSALRAQEKSFEIIRPERRLALVIGNQEYGESPLVNPGNDAREIARVLEEELEFDEVTVRTDLEDRSAMEIAVEEFGSSLRVNDLAFFYYSGHGMQAPSGAGGQRNYLLPTAFESGTAERMVRHRALSQDFVRSALERARLRVLVLDACRNSGYRATKSGSAGLAATDSAEGELLAYATMPGDTASDAGKGLGPYAKELSESLSRGGELREVFDRVAMAVRDRTGRDQSPMYQSAVFGRYYFKGLPPAAGTAGPPADGESAGAVPAAPERGMSCDQLEAEAGEAALEGFVARCGEDPFATVLVVRARERILELQEEAKRRRRSEAGERALAAWRRQDPQTREELAAFVAGLRGMEGTEEAVRLAERRLHERQLQGMEFAAIPPGEFVMGSESGEADGDEVPLTRVRISRGFEMGRHEVTQGQWEAVTGSNPSSFKECGADCPVEMVSWEDVQVFLERLNGMDGEWEYRLPTEAEWEYAARAGTRGDRYGALDAVAWHAGNSGERTHPVGRKAANGWGLHDMLGNVWEWVQDWKGDYPGGTVTDPTGPSAGSTRVYRGGSWNNNARYCAPYRCSSGPGLRYSNLGFRLLRTEK